MSDKAADLALSAQNIGVLLAKRYGLLGLKQKSHWAVKDVSFRLPKGQVLGIMGRNGSGKTTLMRTLAGIIRPDRGHVFHHGNTVCLLSLAVGFMTELTGRENAVLSGMLMGRTKAEMEDLLDRIQDFSEIKSWFDIPVSTYSTGMRQRLAFSIALNVRADVLLLDEILSVGDEGFREKSKEAMQDLIKSDRTVILVSNNTRVVEDLCDMAIWIEDGRSVLNDDPAFVRQTYLRYFQRLKDRANEPIPEGFVEQTIEESRGIWQRYLERMKKAAANPAPRAAGDER